MLVGEERGSDGALAANRRPHLARYLIGGEPTGSRFVAGSKGCLRIEVEARGVSGHSSIPESGRSAVDPLLDFLNDLRELKLPEHPAFGRTTMNIGVLQAGTAPNVIAESAHAEVIFRTGHPIEALLAHVRPMAQGKVLGCFGLTEPMSGSDAGTMATFAEHDGDSWVLNGSKNFITNGPHADLIIVFAMSTFGDYKFTIVRGSGTSEDR